MSTISPRAKDTRKGIGSLIRFCSERGTAVGMMEDMTESTKPLISVWLLMLLGLRFFISKMWIVMTGLHTL